MTEFKNPENNYRLEQVLDMEKDMLKKEDAPVTRITESQFMRSALPILKVLITDVNKSNNETEFDALAWSELVGSWYVPLEVVSDDLTKVLWELPPLLRQGYSLKPTASQPTLSEQTAIAGQHMSVHAEAGNNLLFSTLSTSLDVADYVAYKENYVNACKTITILNKIFKHYGINGQIPFPEGLKELTDDNEISDIGGDKAKNVTDESNDVGFSDGEDI